MPGSILGTRNTVVNKMAKGTALIETDYTQVKTDKYRNGKKIKE